jgi:protoheme IX farnesyltransferase
MAREIAAIPAHESARRRSRLLDYVALTRPRVLLLVLLTAPPAIALGHAGWPAPGTIAALLAGTALVGAGCGALNAWWERERDALMERTRERPLPAGRLAAGRALAFGIAISALGLGLLLAAGGALAAGIGLVALVHYLLVYTLWLKPRTPLAVVVGGASGAIAPLIADAGVDGAIGVWGLVLFGIVFLWQPAHFWAIALTRKEDYAAAGFPTLPAVAGDRATRRQMLAWTLALLPVTLLPWGAPGLASVYGITALVTGGAFVLAVARAIVEETQRADRRVFHASIVHLGALFAAMLLEIALRGAGA